MLGEDTGAHTELSTTEMHKLAMERCDDALDARARKDFVMVAVHTLSAYHYERLAAETLRDRLDAEPSRSVLYRSAATLACDCGQWQEASELAAQGLAGSPQDDIAQELAAIAERVASNTGPKPQI